MAIHKLASFCGVAVALFITSNRMLFGLSTGRLSEEHTAFIKPKNDELNYYLEKHHKQIGADFVPYRNHCLRVMAFTRYFLAQDNIELPPRTFTVIAMALAYHDIALWTDGALNYLDPSVDQMNMRVTEEMQRSKQQEGDDASVYVPKMLDWSNFMEEESEIAKAIILEHHKLTSYTHKANETTTAKKKKKKKKKGNNDNGDNNKDQSSNKKAPLKVEYINEIVNAVRKADWADATMGVVRFGLPQSVLGAAYEAIPEAGFHNILMDMGGRLSPDSLIGQMDVFKILKL